MNPILIKSRWIPVILFFFVIWLGLHLVHLDYKVRQSEYQRVTHEVLSAHALEVGRTLSNALSATNLIRQGILANSGRLDNPGTLTENIFQQFPGISSVQLSPLGEASLKYSSTGSTERSSPHNLPDASTKISLDQLAEDHIARLQGPISLPGGEYIFRADTPVFLNQSAQPRYWGMAAVEMHVHDLLTVAGLPDMVEQGYYYELAHINDHNGTLDSLSTSNTTRPDRLMSMEINAPANTLLLSIGCSRGAIDLAPLSGILFTLTLAFSLALLCRKMMTEPEKLRAKVASQTKDLRVLAYTDSLTNLANRKGFTDYLKTLIDDPQHDEPGVALLMFDLDDFKIINDTMGHPTGDELLVGIANRIASVIPQNSKLARLGGDEFTVTIADTDIVQQANVTAQIIKSCFDTSFKTATNQIYISVSIGYAILSNDIDTADKLLVAADQALYHAKKYEGKSICKFTNDMLETARRKQILTSDLREAIQNGELEVLYQPIFCTVRSEIRKAEALLRWNHPEFGTISPLEFIPIAEQTGLIVEIGHWVFTQASSQAKIWRELHAPGFQISINVSPIQFNAGTLAANWIRHLQELALPGGAILLEITENVLMHNCDSLQQQLIALRQTGVEVALDDFGTGYSSLSYLRNFNIDYVKIDRSFIKNVTKIQSDKVLCSGIIAIATQLGLKVVSEGVETEEQHNLMIELGCHYCQGYLFSKPITVQAFKDRYLHKKPTSHLSVTAEAA